MESDLVVAIVTNLIAFLIFATQIDRVCAFSHSQVMIRVAFLPLLLALFGLPAAAGGSSVAGSEWGLGGSDPRYIQFGPGGKASGDAGCNRFTAIYLRTTSKLRFGPVASTRKLCPPAQMQMEQEWLGILARVRSFEMTHLKLTLYGPKRKRLVVLQRRDWD